MPSLVGSEMCIRDSSQPSYPTFPGITRLRSPPLTPTMPPKANAKANVNANANAKANVDTTSGSTNAARGRRGAAADPGPAEKRKNDDPMQSSSAKMPSLREQLTMAYENRVAETKATRDPRLLKGNPFKPRNIRIRYKKQPTTLLSFRVWTTIKYLFPHTYLFRPYEIPPKPTYTPLHLPYTR